MTELLTVHGGKRTTYLPAQSASSRAYPLTPEQAQSLERNIQGLRPSASVEPAFVPQGNAQENAIAALLRPDHPAPALHRYLVCLEPCPGVSYSPITRGACS
jgi:hypothetical protein